MDSFPSCLFSRRDVNRTEVEEIGIGIVAVDFEDLGNETATRTAVLRQNSATAECHPCNMLHEPSYVIHFKCARNFGEAQRRILAHHYRPRQDSGGPSWLTFLGHMKDSLWSIDLFKCKSATLRSYWVLVVMDQYTRRIIGFGVHAGTVDGGALCRMFNCAIRGQRGMPKYLSSDNDPLYRFHQWQANLRILEATEIKSIPYVPLSHPFVERLIGTLRREYLDHILFWTTADLENKLLDFRAYFNNHRTHTSLHGRTPDTTASRPVADLRSFRWQPHCRALYQTAVAA